MLIIKDNFKRSKTIKAELFEKNHTNTPTNL